MKRKMWVIGGSVGAGVLLVLAMLPTVVSAQTTKMTINDMYQTIKNELLIKKKNDLKNAGRIGFLLALLIDMLAPIIYLIFAIIGSLG
ncbi:MAG: hypothetical protein NT038_06555 [Euryarchaeota archaeon]|nr:hypothetical protein [Euryarchaeota archaeon]